jgi:hypothetical protein
VMPLTMMVMFRILCLSLIFWIDLGIIVDLVLSLAIIDQLISVCTISHAILLSIA